MKTPQQEAFEELLLCPSCAHMWDIVVPFVDVSTRRWLVSGGEVPHALLDFLAGDADVYVRRNVAGNRRTSPHRLAMLSRDTDLDIAMIVARNPSSPPAVLRWLARDGRVFVRRSVAENPNIPPVVGQGLQHVPDAYVTNARAVVKLRRSRPWMFPPPI